MEKVLGIPQSQLSDTAPFCSLPCLNPSAHGRDVSDECWAVCPRPSLNPGSSQPCPAPHPRLPRNRTISPCFQLLRTGAMVASLWEGVVRHKPPFFLDRAITLPNPVVPETGPNPSNTGLFGIEPSNLIPGSIGLGPSFPPLGHPGTIPVPLAQTSKIETKCSSSQTLQGRDQASSPQSLLRSKLLETEPRVLIQMLLKDRTDPFLHSRIQKPSP